MASLKTAAAPILVWVLALGALALPGAGQAHHSFAMFDQTKVVTIKGIVKELQWTNPHAALWFYAETPAGDPGDLWTIELTSPGNLTRAGWTRQVLKAGDKVTVDISPMRDGQHGGTLKRVVVAATGKELTFSFGK